MLEHGGRLIEAAQQYGIALPDWVDLSTGINPEPYPVGPLPVSCWQRLPEDHDGLEQAAAAYYGASHLLVVAGSQAAIQTLPTLLPRGVMACASPLYEEHPHAWQQAGHEVRRVAPADFLQTEAPVLLLCHPNNPTGHVFARDDLLALARHQTRQGRLLIVDEAFIDATSDATSEAGSVAKEALINSKPFGLRASGFNQCFPNASLVANAGQGDTSGLIVLRSLGKFFGLAGARVGFVFGAPAFLSALQERLGPWAVSGPARRVAQMALSDRDWQARQRVQLAQASQHLRTLLQPFGTVSTCALFSLLSLSGGGQTLAGSLAENSPAQLPAQRATQLAEHLARQGLWVRRFPATLPTALRFGLPADENQWQRLEAALRSF